MIQQHKLHALPLIIGINTSRPSAPTATPIPIRVPPIEVGQGRPPKTLTHLSGRLPIPHTPPPPPPRLRHRSRHRLQTEPPSVSSNQGANVVPPPPTPPLPAPPTPPPQSPPTPTPPSPPARRPAPPSPPIQPRRRRRVQLPDRGRRRLQHSHRGRRRDQSHPGDAESRHTGVKITSFQRTLHHRSTSPEVRQSLNVCHLPSVFSSMEP